MPDYYSLLVQKIREAETDSGKLRELVYDAARLALKRHVNVHYPALSLQDGKHLLDELEAAIACVEADHGGTANGPAAAGEDTNAVSAPSRLDRMPKTVPQKTEHRNEAPSAVTSPFAQDGFKLLDWPLAEPLDRAERSDIAPVPDRSQPDNGIAAGPVRPNAYALRWDESYRDLAKPPDTSSWIPTRRAIAAIAAVVIAAGAALYVTTWGRAPSPAAQDVGAATRQRTPISSPAASAGANPGPATKLSSIATGASATTTEASAPFAWPRALPRPTTYGVYAISNKRLIELEQISASPVDPRAGTRFQITKPGRTVLDDARPSFVAYHRDLATGTPERVSVRIAARIARAMTLDPLGKAVMEPPPTETWLIRDLGYDFQAWRVSGNAEIVMLRPQNDQLAFPPGRYELVLGGQFYDFVIAGIIDDPTQCVEGVTTPRGPAFYECRTP
jgi:hypothetical protein